jgi:uncharacterized protein (DUF2342 family)
LLDRAWLAADNLPSMVEIRDPRRWIDRVGGPELAGSLAAN